MGVLYTLIGAGLIAAALRDIFQELFKPNADGRLSHLVTRNLWHALRRIAARNRRVLALAGPINLISVALLWVVLLAIGWALVIWPHLPQGFLLSTGLTPSDNGGFVDALYISMVTLMTIGYGDITPTSDWLRILLPLEALVGMVVLTASVSWILSLYPVIAQRRHLAHTTSLIRQSEAGFGELGKDDEDAQTLESLALQLATVEGDLNRFPVTYYFHEENEQAALPAIIPELLRLAENGAGASQPALRRRAAMLRNAVENFSSALVARGFVNLSSSSVDDVLEAYARDHFHTPKTTAGETSTRDL